MNKPPIKIAVAQSYISADVRENGREIRRLMEQAQDAGAALIHFPEGAMSGYSKSQIKSWDNVDWDALTDELRLTADHARSLNLWTVVGSNHRLTPPNRPHNSLYIIDSKGKLLTRYDKQFISNNEVNNWYTPGREYCVFETEGWRFGCAMCIEIQFPEVFQKYSALDVDCVLFSSYSESAMFGTQAQGYAASHGYWISFSVPAQTSHALSSRLVAPTGEIQSAAAPSISTVVTAMLDTEAPEWKIPLKHARPWRTTAREGSIYRERYVQDPRSDEKTSF